MSSVNLKYTPTNKLVIDYDQKRTWLSAHTDSPDFEQELNRRDTDIECRKFILRTALKESNGTGYFTVGERICINQELGYLFSIGGSEELREYKVPESIERKIKQLK